MGNCMDNIPKTNKDGFPKTKKMNFIIKLDKFQFNNIYFITANLHFAISPF